MKFINILLIQAVLVSGCGEFSHKEALPNNYYLNPNKNLNTIGKTALIELANYSAINSISAEMTESLFQEIQKSQLFGLVKITQYDPAWRSLQLDADKAYAIEDLAQIRKTLKCDALMTGAVTVFEPYPHLTIGLRLRLIDLSDGQILWGMEQVWDTTDKSTRNRIEAYYSPRRLVFKDEDLSGQLGAVSSIKFFKFVSHEITETLRTD